MLVGIITGTIVGLVIGFFGAGSAVVGLPVILLMSNLDGHSALGTNVLGISMIAVFIFVYRTYRRDILFLEAAVFTIPGLIGNFLGVHIGLTFPGHSLLFILGFLIFLIAGWMYYLSGMKLNKGGKNDPSSAGHENLRRMVFIGIAAFIIGMTAGFFAISGGFLIVPALILVGKLNISEAAGTAIIPIAAFTGMAGIQYLISGSVDLTITYAMVLPGIICGVFGIWAAKHIPKPLMQKLFAVFLTLIGFYMILR